MPKSPPKIDKEELLIFTEKLFCKVFLLFTSFQGAQYKTKSEEYEHRGHKICAINKASAGIFFKVKAFSQNRVLFLFLVVANK